MFGLIPIEYHSLLRFCFQCSLLHIYNYTYLHTFVGNIYFKKNDYLLTLKKVDTQF